MMPDNLDHIIPDATRLVVTLLSTCVLFIVFTASAIAFVMTIFGRLKPDETSKKFLFAVFSVSTIGVFGGLATKSLVTDPAAAIEKIRVGNAREQAVSEIGAQPQSKMTVFIQYGTAAARESAESLRASLPKESYAVPPVDNVGFAIKQNDVRFCDPGNAADAQRLSDLLKTKSFGAFKTVNIRGCDPQKNKNILEVWQQSG